MCAIFYEVKQRLPHNTKFAWLKVTFQRLVYVYYVSMWSSRDYHITQSLLGLSDVSKPYLCVLRFYVVKQRLPHNTKFAWFKVAFQSLVYVCYVFMWSSRDYWINTKFAWLKVTFQRLVYVYYVSMWLKALNKKASRHLI